MSITIGHPAPEFTLYDSEKNKVSLSDFHGKKNVLLLFYPLAFTGVCTAQLCGVRDNIGRYVNEDTQVLGISVDTVWTQAKFKEQEGYNFPLLSDWNKEASSAFGILYEVFGEMKMRGVGKRAAFVVDKQGMIQYAEVLENAAKVPDSAAIHEKLENLR